jgi:hypothetical protein
MAGAFTVAAIKRVWDEAYIHAAICAALAFIDLWLGLKGVSKVADPLAESISDITDFLGDGQDGPTL